MDTSQPVAVKDLGELYADVGACFLAFASALEQKGLLSNAELREAAQERLLTLTVDAQQTNPYHTLRMMATKLPSIPDE